MKSVLEMAREIVTREGGFVDDPDDPGGATNFGVTEHTLRRLGLDVNSDGKVTRDDVRALTLDRAVQIFMSEYFERPGIGRLPEALHPSVFDMQVNSGSQAIGLLQRLLTEFGFGLAVDRVIGPQTIAASFHAMDLAPDHLPDAYGIERRNFYYRLARDRSASRKYVVRKDGGKGGWILRAEVFISPRYHLSDAEHKERVNAWG